MTLALLPFFRNEPACFCGRWRFWHGCAEAVIRWLLIDVAKAGARTTAI